MKHSGELQHNKNKIITIHQKHHIIIHMFIYKDAHINTHTCGFYNWSLQFREINQNRIKL